MCRLRALWPCIRWQPLVELARLAQFGVGSRSGRVWSFPPPGGTQRARSQTCLRRLGLVRESGRTAWLPARGCSPPASAGLGQGTGSARCARKPTDSSAVPSTLAPGGGWHFKVRRPHMHASHTAHRRMLSCRTQFRWAVGKGRRSNIWMVVARVSPRLSNCPLGRSGRIARSAPLRITYQLLGSASARAGRMLTSPAIAPKKPYRGF